MPTPIKPSGKVRKEPSVSEGERDSLAYRMSIEGVTSTPEYIAMIDEQVASGRLTDAVAEAVRTRLAQNIDTKKLCSYPHFASMVTAAVRQAVDDVGYRSSFEFIKATQDSLADFSARTATRRSSATPILTPAEEMEVRTIISQVARDQGSTTDSVLMGEVDRVLTIIRQNIIKGLEISDEAVTERAFGSGDIPRIDIEADQDDMESPADMHMDVDRLCASLETLSPQELSPEVPHEGCKCNGGSCCGKHH